MFSLSFATCTCPFCSIKLNYWRTVFAAVSYFQYYRSELLTYKRPPQVKKASFEVDEAGDPRRPTGNVQSLKLLGSYALHPLPEYDERKRATTPDRYVSLIMCIVYVSYC